MRLIDGDKLSEQMAANFEQCVYDGVDSAECQIALDTISEAPTVDAVEVVRCKDCKHGMKSHLQPRHAKNYLCRHSWEGEYHEPDHFCSYGERKAE